MVQSNTIHDSRLQARKLQDEHVILIDATVGSLQQQAAARKKGHRVDVAAKHAARQRLGGKRATDLGKRTAGNAVERSDLIDRASAAQAVATEQNKLSTSKRREMALKSRAEVFRSMEELRKERTLSGMRHKDQTLGQAAQIRKLDLETRRLTVAVRRSRQQHRAESMSAAAREAGKPRDVPYFHGMYGNYDIVLGPLCSRSSPTCSAMFLRRPRAHRMPYHALRRGHHGCGMLIGACNPTV